MCIRDRTYILWTQAVLCLCHFFSIFSIAFLFNRPKFLCYSVLKILVNCKQEDACSSVYGYKIDSRYLGLIENFNLECNNDIFYMNFKIIVIIKT